MTPCILIEINRLFGEFTAIFQVSCALIYVSTAVYVISGATYMRLKAYFRLPRLFPLRDSKNNALYICHFYVLLTCIIVYQYSETNVMYFLFNLLGIKGLYIFEHYLLILRRSSTSILVQPTDITRTQYTNCRL
jgi:hypothetical protein